MRARYAASIAFAVITTLLMTPAGATAGAKGPKMLDEQKSVLREVGVTSFGRIIVDSAMTREQALGDNVVPQSERAVHAVMKPLLRVVPVAYWGLGANGQPDNRVHVGQIVIHQALVPDIAQVFGKMFQLKFPIQQVVPHSAFGYNDTLAMAANNTSGYRPDSPSEHSRGAAFDINPMQNPFDRSAYNGTPAEPAGAVYNPSAPGTFVMDSELRRYFSSLNWEWGGNWGNPNADPPHDFFRVGYFDYQHFQLNVLRYDDFNATLPPCMLDWTC